MTSAFIISSLLVIYTHISVVNCLYSGQTDEGPFKAQMSSAHAPYRSERSVYHPHSHHHPFWMHRHTLRRGKWRKPHLTYAVSKYPKQLEKGVTDTELDKAFTLWAAASPLTFQRAVTGQRPDIDVRFESGSHPGCERPFDGPNGVLAHSYYPKFGGDVHFDDEEHWGTNQKGVSLVQVATHAVGHALGLRHSYNPSSVMYPDYPGYIPQFHLHPDDVKAIQALYKQRTTTMTPR